MAHSSQQCNQEEGRGRRSERARASNRQGPSGLSVRSGDGVRACPMLVSCFAPAEATVGQSERMQTAGCSQPPPAHARLPGLEWGAACAQVRPHFHLALLASGPVGSQSSGPARLRVCCRVAPLAWLLPTACGLFPAARPCLHSATRQEFAQRTSLPSTRLPEVGCCLWASGPERRASTARGLICARGGQQFDAPVAD